MIAVLMMMMNDDAFLLVADDMDKDGHLSKKEIRLLVKEYLQVSKKWLPDEILETCLKSVHIVSTHLST